jgi:hypothetical protein
MRLFEADHRTVSEQTAKRLAHFYLDLLATFREAA